MSTEKEIVKMTEEELAEERARHPELDIALAQILDDEAQLIVINTAQAGFVVYRRAGQYVFRYRLDGGDENERAAFLRVVTRRIEATMILNVGHADGFTSAAKTPTHEPPAALEGYRLERLTVVQEARMTMQNPIVRQVMEQAPINVGANFAIWDDEGNAVLIDLSIDLVLRAWQIHPPEGIAPEAFEQEIDRLNRGLAEAWLKRQAEIEKVEKTPGHAFAR